MAVSVVHLLLLGLVIPVVRSKAQDGSSSVSVRIDGTSRTGQVSSDFVCATLDWWPPQKCDYGTCSWGESSILNLDLTNQLLQSAVKGLSPLLRIGGSLQDKVIYEVGNIQTQCNPFTQQSGLFGFSDGCLSMSRWDALNQFFQETGTRVAFGLNALYGRETDTSKAWDSSNARDFIQYTADKGYQVIAWELGNELSGSGVGTSLSASQYATDMKTLRTIVDAAYAGKYNKPLLVAPDGFFDWNWYQQLLQNTGQNIIDVITSHIYNLGPGVSTNLVQEILNPSVLGQGEGLFQSIRSLLQSVAPSAKGWIGEAGGAYNSGRHLVTDAFVFSFWYLDQLGMAAKHSIQTYCRQSMIGGNYGLLDHNTFKPNPDYFSALLWKQLMGQTVISAVVSGTSSIRAYAHCSQGDSESVTVLILNLSPTTSYTVGLTLSGANGGDETLTLAQSGSKASTKSYGEMKVDLSNYASINRVEYHLKAANGDIQSQSVLLNGDLLQFSSDNSLPTMQALTAVPSQALVLQPTSIAFVKLTGVSASACQ